jgi:hypothetical protein
MTLPGVLPEQVFVIDTSSILELRRILSQATPLQRQRAFDRLSAECRTGALCFPAPVSEELERGHEKLGSAEDLPVDWVRENSFAAVPISDLFDELRQVLIGVPLLADYDKASGADDADPYVVALALKLRNDGRRVTVVTEDRRDEAYKMSVQTACGLMEIPAITIRGLAHKLGLVIP